MTRQDTRSSWAKGYDADWFRLRDKLVIERGCKCECCGKPVALRKKEAKASNGRLEVAHGDHIISISEAPELRLDPNNIRILAESCHDRHTIKAQGVNKGAAESGCTEEGWPLDPKHGWNEQT